MKRRMGVFAALAVAVLVLGACGQGGTNGGTRADLQMEGTAADGQQDKTKFQDKAEHGYQHISYFVQ